nr:xylulose kinase-1 [Tanacetum cinerariifolium]
MIAFLSKSDTSASFDQIVDFLNAHTIQYALVVNPTHYVLCIKQFWAMATIKKVNDVVQLRALIDNKKVVVSEDVIRRDLHLDDAYGVKCLPNEDIFVELARMGCVKPPSKLTFYKRTAWNEFSCFMASAVICLATAVSYELMLFGLLTVAAVKLMLLEDVIRRDLHLDDAYGVKCLPNEEIFAELTRMGCVKPPSKLTFYKVFFSAQWKFLIHTIVQSLSAKRTAWNEFSCSMASVVTCLATVAAVKLMLLGH